MGMCMCLELRGLQLPSTPSDLPPTYRLFPRISIVKKSIDTIWEFPKIGDPNIVP